jgi:hypothetical protein
MPEAAAHKVVRTPGTPKFALIKTTLDVQALYTNGEKQTEGLLLGGGKGLKQLFDALDIEYAELNIDEMEAYHGLPRDIHALKEGKDIATKFAIADSGAGWVALYKDGRLAADGDTLDDWDSAVLGVIGVDATIRDADDDFIDSRSESYSNYVGDSIESKGNSFPDRLEDVRLAEGEVSVFAPKPRLSAPTDLKPATPGASLENDGLSD